MIKATEVERETSGALVNKQGMVIISWPTIIGEEELLKEKQAEVAHSASSLAHPCTLEDIVNRREPRFLALLDRDIRTDSNALSLLERMLSPDASQQYVADDRETLTKVVGNVLRNLDKLTLRVQTRSPSFTHVTHFVESISNWIYTLADRAHQNGIPIPRDMQELLQDRLHNVAFMSAVDKRLEAVYATPIPELDQNHLLQTLGVSGIPVVRETSLPQEGKREIFSFGEKRKKIGIVETEASKTALIDHLKQLSLQDTHELVPVRMQSGPLVFACVPKGGNENQKARSFFACSGDEALQWATAEEIRNANVLIAWVPKSVCGWVSAKWVNDRNEMVSCPQDHGIYHVRLDTGNTLIVVSGEDTDYSGYMKKWIWMCAIAQMLEKENLENPSAFTPLHGTRIHKVAKNGKSPAQQIRDGDATENMVILGESGVGKSESIEYMLKIKEKILLLHRIISQMPENRSMTRAKKDEILRNLEPLVSLELVATGDDMVAGRVDEEGYFTCVTEEWSSFTRTNFVDSVNAATETIIHRVTEDGTIEPSQNARVIRHNPDGLALTHNVCHRPDMLVLITNTDQPGDSDQSRSGVREVNEEEFLQLYADYQTQPSGTTVSDAKMSSPAAAREFMGEQGGADGMAPVEALRIRLRNRSMQHEMKFVIIRTDIAQKWARNLHGKQRKAAWFATSAKNTLMCEALMDPSIRKALKLAENLLGWGLARVTYEDWWETKMKKSIGQPGWIRRARRWLNRNSSRGSW